MVEGKVKRLEICVQRRKGKAACSKESGGLLYLQGLQESQDIPGKYFPLQGVSAEQVDATHATDFSDRGYSAWRGD